MTCLNRLLAAALLACTVAASACAPGDPEVASPSSASSSELQRQQQRAENVTIYRDDFGVPHIYGKTDADAVFGLLYAQAEDDFPRVERNYVWAIGRLAEVLGEEAVYSDLRARLYMTESEARAAYDQAPEWLQELCTAFADGLNYYLHTHPEVKPALLDRFEPWMPMYFFEGSIGGDIEQIPVEGIEELYGKLGDGPAEAKVAAANLSAGPISQPAPPLEAGPEEGASPERERLAFEQEPSGSNGFAVAGSRTASGKAMLLINPHTSFYFRGEVHVVSEEGLNAYGAVTWGQFFVYQGFNENTGWMHTSTRVDFIDEFVEEVSERDGKLVYAYGGELRPVEVGEAVISVRGEAGTTESRFPTYRTHHGPITHQIDGKWVATRINWDPVNALRQSYLRTKTTGQQGFREVMDIRTNSSNNTVYADSGGNIAYYHGNFVPVRDPRFDYSQPVDGSDPATDWQGLHTVDEVVTVLNPGNGWIQNANSTPFTAAAEFSPKPADYRKYMAPDAENYRGIHAVRVLSKARGLTLDSLIELAYDPALPAFEKLIPGLVEAFDRNAAAWSDLAGPIEELRGWDLRVAEDSVAMSLAHFYGMSSNREASNPRELTGIERFDSFGTSTPDEERLGLFRATVAQLEKDFGSWSTPWGEINRFQRLDGAIDQVFDDSKPSLPVGMASGRWGALASFGAARSPGTKRIYGTGGNSFVAVVEFGERIEAKSLLAGGQSGDPASPHFADQAQRYVARQFKDVAYYREDVERRAQRQYKPGE